ncbi:hypothetical protein BaRGS_00015676 [Batillaria attramentaria]|uniref:Uncharacterized protein n=1 Tax=Batillaria attramentaria TaxID=370345 RepID=A0ABD0L193_9CAEN
MFCQALTSDWLSRCRDRGWACADRLRPPKSGTSQLASPLIGFVALTRSLSLSSHFFARNCLHSKLTPVLRMRSCSVACPASIESVTQTVEELSSLVYGRSHNS